MPGDYKELRMEEGVSAFKISTDKPTRNKLVGYGLGVNHRTISEWILKK